MQALQEGVPPEELQSLLAWAQAERPDVTLAMVSGALSNPAKEYLHKYEANQRPPLRIKYWERAVLERLTGDRPDLVKKYLVVEPGLRSQNEILEAEQEFRDRIWYDRSMLHAQRLEERGEVMEPKLRKMAEQGRQRVEETYGVDTLGPYEPFDWGMLNGKLSALRWVLGDEWDFLDT